MFFQPPCLPILVIVSSQPRPGKEDLFWKMIVQNNVKYMVALEVIEQNIKSQVYTLNYNKSIDTSFLI